MFCSYDVLSIKPFSREKRSKRSYVKSGGKFVLVTAHGTSFINRFVRIAIRRTRCNGQPKAMEKNKEKYLHNKFNAFRQVNKSTVHLSCGFCLWILEFCPRRCTSERDEPAGLLCFSVFK